MIHKYKITAGPEPPWGIWGVSLQERSEKTVPSLGGLFQGIGLKKIVIVKVDGQGGQPAGAWGKSRPCWGGGGAKEKRACVQKVKMPDTARTDKEVPKQ